MAAIHGKSTKVFCDQYDLSAYFRQANKSATVEPGETTTFGAAGSAKTYVVGLNDGTVQVDGLFDGAASAIDEYLASVFVSNTERVVTVAPGGVALGARVWQAHGLVTSWDVQSPVADVVSTSATFQADGGVTAGQSLWDLSAVSSTANGTGVDSGAASTNGGVAHLHVTDNTRNNTVDIKIQHSSDNVTFADLTGATFTQLSAGAEGTERLIVAAGTTVNRYLRVVHTLGAGTGSVTYHASFARR